MDDLKPREKQILDAIKSEVRKKGYPPTVRGIGQAVGLRSSSTVHGHLKGLEKKGYIRRDPSKPRAVELINDVEFARPEVVNVPVVGKVSAGEPLLAVENIEEVFPLPKTLVGFDAEVFMLQVKGDSMVGAGIFDRDYVLVRQASTAVDGEIVVVLIEDDATVKRFFKENDHIRLQPENPHMKPIQVRDVRILGKVIGLYRTLR